MSALSKAGMFRGTITVIIVYIVVTVLILAAMLFQPSGTGAYFAGPGLVFTVTLLVGMTVISMVLVRSVVLYNPSMTFVPVKPISCPDFYSLTVSSDPNVTSDKRATCTANPNVYPSPASIPDVNGNATLKTALKSGLSCSQFYPNVLYGSESPTQPYAQRQAFSSQCQVPWSDNDGNFALLKAGM